MYQEKYQFIIWNYSILFLPFSIVIGSFILNLNLIIITVLFFINIFLNKELRIYTKEKWFLVCCLYFLFQIFSSIINDANLDSIIRSVTFFKFFIFALSLKIILIFNKKSLLYFLKIIFILIIILSVDGIYQYFFGKNLLGFEHDVGRVSGVFGNERILGSYLSKNLFIALPFFFFLFRSSKYKYLFLTIYFSIIAFAILISGERMAFLHFILGLHLLFLFVSLKEFKKILYLFSIYLIILVFILVNDDVKKRVLSITHDQYGISKNFNIKDSYWGAHYLTAYEIFKENPIFGIGPKNFRVESCKDKYSSIDSKKAEHRCTTHPHNIILEILSEQGILGIILFSSILYFIIRKQNLFEIVPVCFLVSLIIYVWPIGTSGSIFTTWNGIFLWINIGLLSYLKEDILNNFLK